jgi:DNA-binding NarL/FixJ family response regulator
MTSSVRTPRMLKGWAQLNGCDPDERLAETVVLVGNALYFSDRLLRMLVAEFQGVVFRRTEHPRDLRDGSPPGCVILHESLLPELPALREDLQAADTVVALAYRDPKAAVETLDASLNDGGRIGFIPMNIHVDGWFSALRLLLHGDGAIPGELLRAWRGGNRAGASAENAEAAPAQGVAKLTPRETQVLEMLAAGASNKSIASALKLSEHTVKIYIHSILRKLRVPNRTCAARWWLSRAQDAPTAEALVPDA